MKHSTAQISTAGMTLREAAQDAEFVLNYQAMVKAMPEHHRRWHAAMMIRQNGGKGVAFVAKITGLSRPTVYKGIHELRQGKVDFESTRQRTSLQPLGRPTVEQVDPTLETDLMEIIQFHTGGDPMKVGDRCVRLSSRNIRDRLRKKGHKIGHSTVIRLLKKTKFSS